MHAILKFENYSHRFFKRVKCSDSFFQALTLISRIYKILGLFLLLALVSPSFFSTETHVSAQSSPPTSLSIGEIYTPPISALNPFNPTSEFTVLGILYDYMFSLNWPPLPYITPVMAGGYSSNANGSQWVVSVRPNLKWDKDRKSVV